MTVARLLLSWTAVSVAVSPIVGSFLARRQEPQAAPVLARRS